MLLVAGVDATGGAQPQVDLRRLRTVDRPVLRTQSVGHASEVVGPKWILQTGRRQSFRKARGGSVVRIGCRMYGLGQHVTHIWRDIQHTG